MPRARPPYSVFSRVYAEVMADLPHAAWFDYVAHYLPGRSLKPVADLFSGPGFMARAARTAGYRSVAIDNHLPFLTDGVCAETTALPFIDQVFAALCAANCSLNYLCDAAALGRHFSECRRVLDDTGVYVFDVCPHERALALHGHSLQALAGRVHFAHRYQSDLKKLTTEVTVTGEESAIEYHIQYIFSPAEIQDAAAAAGFKVQATVENYGLPVTGAYAPVMTWVLAPVTGNRGAAESPRE